MCDLFDDLRKAMKQKRIKFAYKSQMLLCNNSIRHQMETFSTLLAICAWNSPVTGEFLAQRPETRSFDVFFDLRLNKPLSKQSGGWWFETPSRSLWRHCNVVGHSVPHCGPLTPMDVNIGLGNGLLLDVTKTLPVTQAFILISLSMYQSLNYVWKLHASVSQAIMG